MDGCSAYALVQSQAGEEHLEHFKGIARGAGGRQGPYVQEGLGNTTALTVRALRIRS